ncbi:MAG: GFA family protein [Gammaproteobacteria bacterium]|nr:GFA family protein [Gammaproteobacteria bacterium]MDH3431938.1 GFA family protein [Gammaproteobacteria bacterium]MDH3433671.1 GFA family protein [Gammaproteobacteria bacterium]
MIYSGRCFCGDVTFRVTGPVKFACFCHCESCRRASGGVYVPWATFAKDSLIVTSGNIHEHHSSPQVTRSFCSKCGTSLTYEHENRVGQIDISLSSFADPSEFSPSAHIWVSDKLPWVTIDDGLPQYAEWVTSD